VALIAAPVAIFAAWQQQIAYCIGSRCFDDPHGSIRQLALIVDAIGLVAPLLAVPWIEPAGEVARRAPARLLWFVALAAALIPLALFFLAVLFPPWPACPPPLGPIPPTCHPSAAWSALTVLVLFDLGVLLGAPAIFRSHGDL
jgi:hypothetical protein